MAYHRLCASGVFTLRRRSLTPFRNERFTSLPCHVLFLPLFHSVVCPSSNLFFVFSLVFHFLPFSTLLLASYLLYFSPSLPLPFIFSRHESIQFPSICGMGVSMACCRYCSDSALLTVSIQACWPVSCTTFEGLKFQTQLKLTQYYYRHSDMY